MSLGDFERLTAPRRLARAADSGAAPPVAGVTRVACPTIDAGRVLDENEGMRGFTDADCVEDHGWFAYWRAGPVLGVRIVGDLTDEKNPFWRAHIDAHFRDAGPARFAFLDVTQAVPKASLPMRVKTATWARAKCREVEHLVIAVGEDARTSFAVGAILRMAGMGNVTVTRGEREHAAALQAMREGRAPST